MKKFYLKILPLVLICNVLLFSIPQTVFAEEIVSGAPVRWTITSNGYYVTKISTDMLPSGYMYTSQVASATTNWNNTSTKALCSRVSSSNSNVDLRVGSSNFFNQNFPTSWLSFTPAVTILYDTAGNVLLTNADYKVSTGKIRYAQIQFNPTQTSDFKNSSFLRTSVIAHELGHVYGLGHTSRKDSLMSTTNATSYTAPSSYDVQIFNSFYK